MLGKRRGWVSSPLGRGGVTLIGLLVVIVIIAIRSPAVADDLIAKHGKYSQAYQSDWSQLPTGKELAGHDVAQMEFRTVVGEEVRRVFRNEEEVRLSGDRLKVHWNLDECNKYRNTLYLFENCEKVVIEDMAIIQTDPDFRASSTFLFEACGSVVIRDCYIAGTCGKHMIRIEGCEEYFIDRVEIDGVDYPGIGMKAGPGIFINNGAEWDEKKKRPGAIYSQLFRELRWGVIQNCYIHNHPSIEAETNHDGILFHAPADGIVFNCVFENYEGDSCLDISHRRNDPGYQNHHFRIERCIFARCHRVKTNGAAGSGSCSILWCNNVYINSSFTDYHHGWPNWHVHETYIYDGYGGYFLSMRCRRGATLFRNCLMYCPVARRSMYEPWGLADGDPLSIQPDYFLYLMLAPVTWLKPRGKFGPTINWWGEWQAAGHDRHSILTDAAPAGATGRLTPRTGTRSRRPGGGRPPAAPPAGAKI